MTTPRLLAIALPAAYRRAQRRRAINSAHEADGQLILQRGDD